MQPDVEDPVVTPSRKKTPRAKQTPSSGKRKSINSKIAESSCDSSDIVKSQPMDLDAPAQSIPNNLNTRSASRRRTILPPTSIQVDIINESDEKNSMEVEENAQGPNKRQTILTPKPMEETKIANASSIGIVNTRTRSRRTLFTPESMDHTRKAVATPVQQINRKKLILDDPNEVLHTPVIMQTPTLKATTTRKLQINGTPGESLLKTMVRTPLGFIKQTPLTSSHLRKSIASTPPVQNPNATVTSQTPNLFVFGAVNTPSNSNANKSLLEQYTSAPVFNSQSKGRHLSGRLSINDISMEIIDQRVKQINKRYSLSQDLPKSPTQVLLEKPSTPRQNPIDLYFRQQLIKSSEKAKSFQKITASQEKSMQVVQQPEGEKQQTESEVSSTQTNPQKPPIKRRKLFNAAIDENIDPAEILAKANKTKRKSCSLLSVDQPLAKAIKLDSKTNRRRTLDVFQLEKLQREKKMLNNLANRREMSKKQANPVQIQAPRPPLFVAGTSMHRDQLQKAKEVK